MKSFLISIPLIAAAAGATNVAWLPQHSPDTQVRETADTRDLAERAPPAPVVVTRLRHRGGEIIVLATADGTRYTLTGKDQTVLASLVTLAALQSDFPMMYRFIRQSMATSADPGRIIDASLRTPDFSHGSRGIGP